MENIANSEPNEDSVPIENKPRIRKSTPKTPEQRQRDSEKRRIRHAERRAAGLCTCGKPVNECLGHRNPEQKKHQADTIKQKRLALKSSGKCTEFSEKCSGKLVGIRCEFHTQAINNYGIQRRQEQSQSGLCAYSRCESSIAENGYYCKKHREYLTLLMSKSYKKLRENIVKHYGEKCECCGETMYEFLQIDHKEAKPEEDYRNSAFYRKIRDTNYPPCYQLLCANCNHGKYIGHGICPHKFEKPPSLEEWIEKYHDCIKKYGKIRQTISKNDYGSRNENSCRHCSSPKEPGSASCKFHSEKSRELVNITSKIERFKAIIAYGRKCSCCAESNLELIDIDHIHGGGTQHRKEIKKHGSSFFRMLRHHGYPKDDYRALCFNCNRGRQNSHEKVCPHQTEEQNG